MKLARPSGAAKQEHEQPGRERIERPEMLRLSVRYRHADRRRPTSCDVGPAGLSTRSKPSRPALTRRVQTVRSGRLPWPGRTSPAILFREVRRRLTRFRRTLGPRVRFDGAEQRLDSRGVGNAFVQLKRDLGRDPQSRIPGRRALAGNRARLVSPSSVAARSAALPSTLTNTLACRRSRRDLRRPVTVTRPMMRGSLTPSARNVATASRMASATRSGRRVSWGMSRLASARGRRERAGDLLGAVRLDHVVDLQVVEVLDSDAALEALRGPRARPL